MLFSVEQAFVGREEIRAPLKTPAWEARDFTDHQESAEECKIVRNLNVSRQKEI